MQAATFRSFGHAGAAIRVTAARSIRRRKKPSAPGSAPHTQSGRLKRAIRFAADQHSVVIGPVVEGSGKAGPGIWSLHEAGGVQINLLSEHRFSVGEYGPIRRLDRGFNAARSRFARIKIGSPAQAARATELIKAENRRRAAGNKYPPRPFMGPALSTMRNRLPENWKNSLR